MFIRSQAQTRLSTHDPDLTHLQAFELEKRRIEGHMTAQNDTSGKARKLIGVNHAYISEIFLCVFIVNYMIQIHIH